jgi:hypothetical protein
MIGWRLRAAILRPRQRWEKREPAADSSRRVIRMIHAVAATLILMTSAKGSTAQTSSFLGTWTNENSETRGLSRVEILEEADTRMVKIFAACGRSVCAWPLATAIEYAPHVAARSKDSVRVLVVTSNSSAQVSTVVLHRPTGGRLIADVFTRYLDESGRANTVARLTMIKSGLQR